MTDLVTSSHALVPPLLDVFGIKPGDNVTRVTITIDAGYLASVEVWQYGQSTGLRDLRDWQLDHLVKHFQLNPPTPKEEK